MPTTQPKISQDAQNFLETLLWDADNPDMEERPMEGRTIWEFSLPFIQCVEDFIAGFRTFLEEKEFDMDRLDALTRSFGGSVYFSLSGAGVGFFDEYPPDDRDLGDELQALVREYGGQHRFEEMNYSLSFDEANGTIDLSFIPEAIAYYRWRYFVKGTPLENKPMDPPCPVDQFVPVKELLPARLLDEDGNVLPAKVDAGFLVPPLVFGVERFQIFAHPPMIGGPRMMSSTLEGVVSRAYAGVYLVAHLESGRRFEAGLADIGQLESLLRWWPDVPVEGKLLVDYSEGAPSWHQRKAGHQFASSLVIRHAYPEIQNRQLDAKHNCNSCFVRVLAETPETNESKTSDS